MNWNRWIRQIHRWLSVAFVATVLFTFIALQREQPPGWVTYIALPPLFLLMLSGSYLFVLPYATRWRNNAEGDR